MKPTRDFIIVRTPDIFNDKHKFKGVDGQTIAMNVFYQPERHVRCYAEVLEVPRSLSNVPIFGCADHIGYPNYWYKSSVFSNSLKRRKDIKPIVKPGDIAYFHYNMLLPPQQKETLYNQNWICDKIYEENGKSVNYHIYRIPYDQVFMVSRFTKTDPKMEDHYISMDLVRVMGDMTQTDNVLLKSEDGKNMYRRTYHGVGSWCLVRPDYETWDDILVPTPEVGVNGEPLINHATSEVIMKPKEKWINKKSAPGQKALQGYIEVIDDPLVGDEKTLNKGDHVYLRPKTDTIIVVDGVNYFRVMQRNINLSTDKEYVPVSDEDRKPLSFAL